MTNDPYLSKVAAAPPNDADCDAAYAEIDATSPVPLGPPPPMPRAAPNDPLAVLHAVSEEKLIALFS